VVAGRVERSGGQTRRRFSLWPSYL